MALRVLVVVEGLAAGLDRRDVAAIGIARKLAGEAGASLDVVIAGDLVALPGQWSEGWHMATREPRTVAGEVSRLIAGQELLAIVVGETALGRELGGRVAARLGLPVVAGALSVRAANSTVQVTRPAAAGARSATLTALRLPAIIVASPDIAPGEAGLARAPGVSELLPTSVFDVPPLLGETRLGPWEMDVAEAEVVVSGGRGVGGTDGFELLGQLAERIGGAVGATRVAVDLGWVSRDHQVGLTGRTVSPRLYIACGISGAIHHTLGMRSSGFVAAINTDPRCPIFSIANASVVGDVREVVAALIAEIDRRRAVTSREPVGSAR